MLWFGARPSPIALRIWCCMPLAMIVSPSSPYGQGTPSDLQKTTVRYFLSLYFPRGRVKNNHHPLTGIRDKICFVVSIILFFSVFLLGQYAHPPLLPRPQSPNDQRSR